MAAPNAPFIALRAVKFVGNALEIFNCCCLICFVNACVAAFLAANLAARAPPAPISLPAPPVTILVYVDGAVTIPKP